MIMDYGDMKKYLKPLLYDYLDDYHLNKTTGLVNPIAILNDL